MGCLILNNWRSNFKTFTSFFKLQPYATLVAMWFNLKLWCLYLIWAWKGYCWSQNLNWNRFEWAYPRWLNSQCKKQQKYLIGLCWPKPALGGVQLSWTKLMGMTCHFRPTFQPQSHQQPQQSQEPLLHWQQLVLRSRLWRLQATGGCWRLLGRCSPKNEWMIVWMNECVTWSLL